MTEIRLLLELFNRDFLFKLILVLLIYSLVPLAEIFLFLYLGDLIGNWLVLSLAAVAGVGGALVAFTQARQSLALLRRKIREGRYPGREFADLATVLMAGIFLVTPGFITDVLGYLLLIPIFRQAIGRVVVRKLKKSFREVYEHLRLSAL